MRCSANSLVIYIYTHMCVCVYIIYNNETEPFGICQHELKLCNKHVYDTSCCKVRV